MKIIESITTFIGKWFNRFRVFSHLFAIWAIIYSTINICNFKVAFEYNDGIRFIAKNQNGTIVEERTKIIPTLTALIMKLIGVKVDVIVDKEDINHIKISFADNIYYVSNQNEKYELLERNKYILFFANSDEGIIQAKKAGIIPIRIKRNPKSKNPLNYNPGAFNERFLPLSEI